MKQLILQISDSLAKGLAELAAERKKSIEQVAIEILTASMASDGLRGSPAAGH